MKLKMIKKKDEIDIMKVNEMNELKRIKEMNEQKNKIFYQPCQIKCFGMLLQVVAKDGSKKNGIEKRFPLNTLFLTR